ncbi:RimK/LysX family protein [Thalassospira sp. MCCC 1A01428]|uniref:ATP-dependent zinc protease family protein n=1 Tax=Thalassospira sp. MCCC 1A01428 TaxID=1470575 RepID=UPI000A1DA4EC|nr:RimK/LysX family protein [Thalassospira sp. MCCC 1A01428]
MIEKRNVVKKSLKSQTDALVAGGHVLGWREWIGLPDFGVPLIKAKVDTGARTSSIHATHIEVVEIDHKKFVKFVLPHYRGDGHGRVNCQAPLLAIRHIRSSNGKQDERYIVATHVAVGHHRVKVEISLANRSLMGFPMLLGRTAIKAGRFLVQPAKSYLAGKPEHVYMAEQSVGE